MMPDAAAGDTVRVTDRNGRRWTVDANHTDAGSQPQTVRGQRLGGGGDQVEATGWAAEMNGWLGGRGWPLGRAVALRGAAHYLDPADVQERARRLAEERAETVHQLHGRRMITTPTARCCTGSMRRSQPAACSACRPR